MEQFSYVKRGYSPEEVNKYIATLEQVIKSYKEKDNAIKNAIISAQVAADNVVRNAHMQAHDYKKKITQQLLQVSAAIDTERMRVQAFHDVYSGLMRKYLFEIETADMFEMSRRLDDMEKLVNDLLEMEVPPLGEPTPLLSAAMEPEPAPIYAEPEPVYAPETIYAADTAFAVDPEDETQLVFESDDEETMQEEEPPLVAPPPRNN
ncbi:MAG: DivIVA domain-containing protein [Defluviitaleaceae bacterium]|nr:DivIVA domain-containing protein [Defluviitaleaceae bacterium]